MSRLADLAQEREQIHREESLAMQLACRQRPPTISSKGICIGCLQPIPKQRLRAMPGCSRCVECQEEADHRDRQFSGAR